MSNSDQNQDERDMNDQELEQLRKAEIFLNEKDIKATKECRVALDAALQQVKQLTPSREVSLAITNAQQAIMWLGMNLKELGAKNPYPNSYKPENSTVEPTADGLKL